MKHKLERVLEAIRYAGVWHYFGWPLLPFFAFVFAPSVLHMAGFLGADVVFAVLLLLSTILYLYNIMLIISAIYCENDDMLYRRGIIFVLQTVSFTFAIIMSKLVGPF